MRPEVPKVIAAIFTIGKDHPGWAAAAVHPDDADAGAVQGSPVRVTNIVQAGMLMGSIAIDVAATAGPVTKVEMTQLRGLPQGVRAKSFDEARDKTLGRLLHELHHVHEVWRQGRTWFGRNVADVLYDEAFRRDGYGNVYEKRAFAFENDWIATHRGAIRACAYDHLLPIAMIERFAPRARPE
ncbi:hypothetical protein J5Y09_10775 [Roseomonas sp. PWR1]|uniref:Phage metallopeptidase domain-containing protein n=1 Tax=Roseomonas nitratireducens TaxID=2820810 RepID=A0ABS4AU75_9PROT|nr:hypothetical protein [Neoroseomonas nitratireducens]MBP0464398.1 hypothetical protein [Neoroseomonas nitratireducens]